MKFAVYIKDPDMPRGYAGVHRVVVTADDEGSASSTAVEELNDFLLLDKTVADVDQIVALPA
jgi:hypothetical protein